MAKTGGLRCRTGIPALLHRNTHPSAGAVAPEMGGR